MNDEFMKSVFEGFYVLKTKAWHGTYVVAVTLQLLLELPDCE